MAIPTPLAPHHADIHCAAHIARCTCVLFPPGHNGGYADTEGNPVLLHSPCDVSDAISRLVLAECGLTGCVAIQVASLR